MSDRMGRSLLRTPTIGVYDVRCFAPAGGPGPDEQADQTQVVLPLAGVFEVHHGREAMTADAASVVVFDAERAHRVAHPATGGDRSMVMVYAPEVAEEALGGDGPRGGAVGSRVHLGARILASGLAREAIGELEAEEMAIRLLDLISADLRGPHGYRPAPHQRDRIERVRALLAVEPERRWRLDELARAVHCSPFHLARQFRALTGSSIWRHLLRLRMAVALQRLAEGERDLAGLAADLGFASQSHFGARFRSAFGAPPGRFRDTLAAGRLDELRTFVTAQERAAS
ncbi:MAG TPA: AraC family transcriptional regulator [Actinomycetota bacterium]|nr:AraC family transcriptional regulator [Actinomycetota bacterium]